MKKLFVKIYLISILVILLAKILNWFLKFPDHVNTVLNTTLFCLIGFAYIVRGWASDANWEKMVIISCGAYLIAMNFFASNLYVSIAGIICLIVPMIIGGYYKKQSVGF